VPVAREGIDPFVAWLGDRSEEVARRLSRNITYASQGPLVAAIVNAGVQATALGLDDLATLAQDISSGVITSQQLKQAHEQIAKRAQQATANAYDQRQPRRRIDKIFSRYARRPNRFAGGALRRAIMNPDFYRADAHGISFINESLLTREAAHWKRLNFGAGAGATRPPRQYAVDWGGLVVATLGLQPDPQPAFLMPPGFWVRASRYGQGLRQESGQPGTGGFFPTGKRLVTPTRGIAATNFLDTGVRTIAQEFPKAYQEMFARHLAQVRPNQQPVLSKVTIRGHEVTKRPDLTPEVKFAWNVAERAWSQVRPEYGKPLRTQGPRMRPRKFVQ
jgi:hypothetical protein